MNSNILITGAGGRIGAAIARGLAVLGHNIIVHYNSSGAGAERVCAEIAEQGGHASSIRADLQNSAERAGLIELAAKPFGPLDVLINNASAFEPDSARTLTERRWDAHFDLHAKAPAFLAQDFAAQLPPEKKGNIINMIDERVLRNSPGYFSYSLSKSVLWTATRTLAQSLAPRIRVNAIGPGPVLPHDRQNLQQFQESVRQLPLQLTTTPEEIVQAIRFLLDTPSLTGQMLALDGGEHLEWRGRDDVTPARDD